MSLAECYQPDTKPDLKLLLSLLAQKRPSGDKRTYKYFADYLAQSLPGYVFIERDKNNNYWVIMPNDNGTYPKHAFTSHYDTVHRDYGKNEVYYDTKTGIIKTNDGKKGTPLGADDGAGIFIMLSLIRAQIPGIYIFFSDEEVGGIGSSNFDLSLLPVNIDLMLSLDRQDTNEVIITQGFEQGASVACGQWLADNLNANSKSFDYAISENGVFTDSANFAGIIPQCLNLSVGYYEQHTKRETLDVKHVLELIAALKNIDFSSAPVGDTSHFYANDLIMDYCATEFYLDTSDCLAEYIKNNALTVARFLRAHNVTIDEIETY